MYCGSLKCGRRHSEKGYTLLYLILMMALIALAMAAAAPRLATEIKRDREDEMIHRGVQYARAIQKFYKKFGRYPTTLKQLENTNNIRFIRRLYKDPMTKDGSWKLVHVGDIQFGQTGGLGSLPASQMGQGGLSGSPDMQGSQPGGLAPQGTTPSQGATPGTPASGENSGQSGGGEVFGGGAIIGVVSKSKAQGLHEFGGKSHYNEWYFVYDPLQDRGALIRGPYNPQAFQGQYGTPGGTGLPGTKSPTSGTGLPNIPGVTNPGGVLNPTTPTSPPQTP